MLLPGGESPPSMGRGVLVIKNKNEDNVFFLTEKTITIDIWPDLPTCRFFQIPLICCAALNNQKCAEQCMAGDENIIQGGKEPLPIKMSRSLLPRGLTGRPVFSHIEDCHHSPIIRSNSSLWFLKLKDWAILRKIFCFGADPEICDVRRCHCLQLCQVSFIMIMF